MNINPQMIQGLLNQIGGAKGLQGVLGGGGGGAAAPKGPGPLNATPQAGLVGAGQIREAGRRGTGLTAAGHTGPALQEIGEQYQQGVVDRMEAERQRIADTMPWNLEGNYRMQHADMGKERQGGAWAGFFGLLNANERAGKAPKIQYNGE